MEVTGKVYEMNYGNPFELKNIDRLFYACTFLNSSECFLMEKEKFDLALSRGRIKEYRPAIGF